MKALVSPNEVFVCRWVTSWQQGQNDDGDVWFPEYNSIADCQRVVELSSAGFEVAAPLFWVDCPDDCTPTAWYFKNGELHQKPQDVPQPETP